MFTLSALRHSNAKCERRHRYALQELKSKARKTWRLILQATVQHSNGFTPRRYLLILRQQSTFRRIHCLIPYTPGRHTRYAIPLFLKYPRFNRQLEYHKFSKQGYPKVSTAAGSVRHRAVSPSTVLYYPPPE